MGDAVATICAQMRSKGIVIPRDNEWLNACIECFTSNNPRHSPSELFDFVFEQWTLADLKDVAAGTLPPACSNCTKMILRGNYAVQFNYFLNVAIPFHKQLQKIRRPGALKNLEVDNEREEKDTYRSNNKVNNRSLKIEICDGVTTVVGFELSPIPSIQNKIPGEKAILKGPIEVRKGVLMLNQDNVMLLGGEVDTLLIPNAEENLLARALKQPENPDPYNVENRANVDSEPGEPTRPPIPQPAPVPNTSSQFQSSQSADIPLEMLDDGVDDALLASLAALENESFTSQEPAPNSFIRQDRNPPTAPSHPRMSQPIINRPVASSFASNRHPTTPVASKKRPNPSSASKVQPKQQSITSFLSQPKKPDPLVKPDNRKNIFDMSSEMDDFDDDFELLAAQTASLAEQSALSRKYETNQLNDPQRLKAELQMSYSCNNNPVTTKVVPPPVSHRPSSGPGRPEADASVQKKRKDPLELDVFGRPKIPRGEENSNTLSSSSSSTSEASVFRNPVHEAVSARDSHSERSEEETFDWLPPPQKANLDHLRPSHEKGKILVDYTDASTLDLDSVPSQKSSRTSSRTPSRTSSTQHSPPRNPINTGEPFPPKDYPSKRTVLGKVVKVVNKLQLRNAQWVLSALVEAKGIEMEMDFSPQTLDKIFTVTAEEVTRQKDLIRTDKDLKEKFNALLRESQQRIQTLHCEMVLHFKNFISKPIVVDVLKDD